MFFATRAQAANLSAGGVSSNAEAATPAQQSLLQRDAASIAGGTAAASTEDGAVAVQRLVTHAPAPAGEAGGTSAAAEGGAPGAGRASGSRGAASAGARIVPALATARRAQLFATARIRTAAAVKRLRPIQADPVASAAATALASDGQAREATGSLPSLVTHEAPAVLLAPVLQGLIVQFQSLSRDSTAATALSGGPAIARASSRELASVVSSLAPLSEITAALPAHRATAVNALGELSGQNAGLEPRWPPGSGKLALHHNPLRSQVGAGTSPTAAAWPPSVTGAAFGNGGNGLAAPAAALLAIALMCLLGTRWAGRQAEDPFTWTSALLCLRLERPG
jgi:hypothetical protein